MFTINSPKNELLCIYGVIRPLYVVAHCYGFFPFSLSTDTNGVRRINFTTVDLITLLIQVTIYSCFAYVNMAYNLLDNESAMSPILALGIRIGIIFGLMNSVAFVFADLFNRYQILDIFKLYQKFDLKVNWFVYPATIFGKQWKLLIEKNSDSDSSINWHENISDAITRINPELPAEQAIHLWIHGGMGSNFLFIFLNYILDLLRLV